MSVAFAAEEENGIKQLEQSGIMRKSSSPWASQICLVWKKSGKIRSFLDYRRLNGITVKGAFLLPRINDCLDTVAGAKLFTSLDLASSFHRVPIKGGGYSQICLWYEKWIIQIPINAHGYVELPSGSTANDGLVLNQLQLHSCLIYLDDVLIYGSDFQEHMQRLNEVCPTFKMQDLNSKQRIVNYCASVSILLAAP